MDRKIAVILVSLSFVLPPVYIYSSIIYTQENVNTFSPDIAVVLGSGTAGSSEIGVNGTSALVNVIASGNWWNLDYGYRRQISIVNNIVSTLGSSYSVCLTVNTTSLVSSGKMLSNGNDLRIVYWNGSSWVEIDRYVIDMNTGSTQIWFKTRAEIGPSPATDNNYYMYYSNPSAENPPADRSNVYLWFDDFSTNTTNSYDIDRHANNWHGSAGNVYKPYWDSANNAVYFDTNDNYAGGWMPNAINQTDVYAEMKMKITGSYPTNTTNGILLRWQNKDTFYGGHISGDSYTSPCLVRNGRTTYIAYKSPSEYHMWNQWFTFAVAVWGSNLKLWVDGIVKVSGTDTQVTASGKISFLVAQATGWMDDFKIRKYVEPEPSTYTGSEQRNIEDYVDNNTSDVDSSADKGTHGNFSAQQYGPDSINDALTEEKTAGANWWNSSWQYRKQINVTTGSNNPYNGYENYSVRFVIDTTDTTRFQTDCDDLRVVYWTGSSWTELNRYLIDCTTSTTKVWFKLQTNISASSYDDNYYVYYKNDAAANPPNNRSNVFLFFDDFSSNPFTSRWLRGSRYCDIHGEGYTNPTYDAVNEEVDFDTGDNNQSDMVIAGLTGEKDIYIQIDHWADGSYPTDATDSIGVRISAYADPSTHEYLHFSHGSYTSAGIAHDSRTNGERNTLGGSNSPNVYWAFSTTESWGVGVFDTTLKFFRSVSTTISEPWPSNLGTTLSGTTTAAQTGYIGVAPAQSRGRWDNVYVRRYTEPEPSVSVGEEETVNHELDLEVQWTNVNYDGANAELCIETGTTDAEDIKVDVWNGSAWVTVFTDLTPSSWNNVSVSSYLTSSNFTIRFKGGTETGDANQDSWNIDATLLHVWTSTYDYVLSVTSQKAYDQNIRLNLYNYSSIGRLRNCTTWFRDGTTSVQINITNGVVIQDIGPWYLLPASETRYIPVRVEESASGTSVLSIKLEAVKASSIIYTCLIKLTVN